jgi:HlyD family secretion protein
MKILKLPQLVILRTAMLIFFNIFLIANAIWLRRYIVKRTDAISNVPTEQIASRSGAIASTKINAVAALGTIEPEGEVITLAPRPSIEGSIVEKLLVKVGDRVKTGQTIAILDNRNRLEASLLKAKAQVRVTQARLQKVQAGASISEIDAQKARINNLAAELNGQTIAQLASIKRLEAELRGDTQAQTVNIAKLKAELNNTKTECHRFESLYLNRAVSVSEKDLICLQAETAAKRLEEAKVNHNLSKSTISQQIQEAKANLKRTELTLAEKQSEAKANLEQIIEIRPTDIAVVQTEVEEALAAMKQAQIDLESAYVRSPQNGQILKINTRKGEKITGTGILELGQTEQMMVRAEVYETDINKVSVNQPVTITSSNFQGELKGTVAEIELQISKKDVLGTDPVADVDARVVEVKIRLDLKASQKVANLTNLQVYAVINTKDTGFTPEP